MWYHFCWLSKIICVLNRCWVSKLKYWYVCNPYKPLDQDMVCLIHQARSLHFFKNVYIFSRMPTLPQEEWHSTVIIDLFNVKETMRKFPCVCFHMKVWKHGKERCKFGIAKGLSNQLCIIGNRIKVIRGILQHYNTQGENVWTAVCLQCGMVWWKLFVPCKTLKPVISNFSGCLYFGILIGTLIILWWVLSVVFNVAWCGESNLYV
jgi:hypothetical protein